MKCYNVYINSKSKFQDTTEDIVLIKDGFNWSCFIFGSLWALYKRVWNVLWIYLVVIIISILITKIASVSASEIEIIKIFISMIIAFSANEYYGKSLLKRGYKFIDITHGESREEALLRFLDKHNLKDS
jgi:hypothetical protein